ncbi:pentatricopeptide repeat-containing protein At3g25210, mitochondrial [Phalaenopsis equestris]|uniref:pentatricopeptide repeat-containing protein At3g25210, mitochondrial n=1 Tax=Phalaenopsis equestris TaxID=78828 RepID=UPI0009E41240|nr:pentatricopeptide repeat-containing protein At3g25210, mitochondrial [Phalaenopsis equestris]XP_020582198.1 pentatricopeptide repeat-containing protein At3g25210, mitochondrial [Phalaenopsis equestris]XP_020582199.1 pentatricopeptide repeat-containing protein At3g25210, mitochondrial [Phalaenopsis equestris]
MIVRIPRLLSKTKPFLLQHQSTISILLLSHFRALSTCPFHDHNPKPRTRSLTPLERQFETWVSRLSPGFTSADVDAALRDQSDPDLALDIFRWTALQPGYRHSPSTYHTMLHISVTSRRFSTAESLISDVLSGVCPPDLPLLNYAIRFCCSQRRLFSRAFELYRLMLRSAACRPSLETFSLLLAVLVNRFGKPPICYIYLRSVRSLVRQMKASGVIPDTYTLNIIIKAYSICLDMDEAMRVFREMELYECEPNEYTYGYITKGFCEKGLVDRGFGSFNEMRDKGFVPTSSVYMVLICSLAMVGRFEESIRVLFDMLENSLRPDILTYRTILEGMCRGGQTEEAFKLLEELGSNNSAMDRKVYSDLLDGLHWLCNPQD